MTTTETLREALHGVEPGWQAPSVAGVRKRARRVQLRRRVAGVVAAAAAFATVVTLAPMVLRLGEPSSSTASLHAEGTVPTSPAQAQQVTWLVPRTGPLPMVRSAGPKVSVPFVSDWQVQVRPAALADRGAGQLCVVQAAECQQFTRSAEGWVTGSFSGGAGVGSTLYREQAQYWVVDGPVGSAVASVRGRPLRVAVRELGSDYRLISVEAGVKTAPGDYSGSVAPPDQVWVFDPAGRLIARHRE